MLHSLLITRDSIAFFFIQEHIYNLYILLHPQTLKIKVCPTTCNLDPDHLLDIFFA